MLLRLPATAVSPIFACLGIKGRFLFGAACKEARHSVLDTPAHWHNVHLDTLALSELVVQTTHARECAIGSLEACKHPMHAARRLTVSLDGPKASRARKGMFKWYHLLTILRSFLKGASYVQMTGDVRTTSLRDFLLLVVPCVMPVGKPRRLPQCVITANRFCVTRDDDNPSVGMSHKTALNLLEQGKFFDKYFAGLKLNTFGGADCFARSEAYEAEQYCKSLIGLLTLARDGESPRACNLTEQAIT
jgi:hypothetical protein